MQITPETITHLFTRDGAFHFARWGRPVAPVVFGLDEASLDVMRAAIQAVFRHAGHPLTDTDPESGVNYASFFVRDWAELSDVTDFDRMIGVADLPRRLAKEQAEHYQIFRFDRNGAIRACFSLIRPGAVLGALPIGALAERLAVRATLSFAHDVRPSADLARIIRAAYAPDLPQTSDDSSLAYRIFARIPPSNPPQTAP